MPTSPRVRLNFADTRKEITNVAHCESEVCLMSGRMYKDLTEEGLCTLEMPIEEGILINGLGTRSKKIKRQVLL
jgi:hypothetical protein